MILLLWVGVSPMSSNLPQDFALDLRKNLQDGSLYLAQRLYLEGHVPGPFWFTLGAENSSISAEGPGIFSNGTKSYLQLKVRVK